VISNTARHEELGLPDDADARRLCVREAVLRIKDKIANRTDEPEPEESPRLPEGYEDSTWEAVDDADKIKQFVRDVCARKSWPLYIHGRPGVGKTSVAALIYSAWTMQPLWLRADTTLREIAFSNNEDVRAWRKRIKQAPCVFLDDLGVQAPNPQMLVALFDLLEDRKNRPLIITGNHNLQSLLQIYEPRIVSRLSAGATLWLDGNDQRKGQGDRLRIGASK
jgi:DNA replication protein DnaC